jgi:hypothetical protein
MVRQSAILVSLSPISYIHLYNTVPWVKENWSGRTWYKSGGVVTDYCLDDKGSIPGRGRNSSLLRGGSPSPYQRGTGGLLLSVNQPGHGADNLAPSCARA